MKKKNFKEQETESAYDKSCYDKATNCERVRGNLGLKVKRLFATFAAMCLATTFVGGMLGYDNSSSLSAKAYSSNGYDSDWSSSEDLLKSAASGGEDAKFNLGVLQSVAKSAGYSSLIKLMGAAASGEKITASSFLTNPDDSTSLTNGPQILFGGLYWMPVYMTTDKSGDVILDLMLASSTSTSANGTETNEKTKWCEWTGYINADQSHQDSLTYDYPSNMYSTSLARSVLVGTSYSINTTGQFKANSNADIALVQGTQSSKWNTFLTNLGWEISSSRNYCKFLDTPSQVAYQETETITSYPYLWTVSGKTSCPNDAYGEVAASSFMGDYANYSSETNKKALYTDWMYDYLWLPSVTEAGVSGRSGMWQLNDAQLANTGSTWYRSGGVTNSSYAFCVDADGKYTMYNGVTQVYGLRPAIHLNLSKVTNYKFTNNPTAEKATYTGKQMDVASITSDLSWYDESKMTITFPENCKNAGEYTCTVTIPDDSEYYFDNGEKTATFTLTIEKAPLTVTVNVDENNNVTTTCVGLKGDDGTPPLEIIYYDQVNDILFENIDSAEPGEYLVYARLKDADNSNYVIKELNPGKYIVPEKVINNKDVLGKPVLTQNSFVYSGTSVNIQNYLEVLNLDKQDISGDLTPVNVGNYTVTVAIKSDVDAYWADGANDDTRELITYSYAITKAPLKVVVTVDDEGNITTECTGMVNGEPEPSLILEFYSEETGEKVDENNLEPGVYDVKAKLVDDNGNYEITELEPGEYIIPEEYKEPDEDVEGKEVLAIPVLTQNSFVYSGKAVDIQNYLKVLNLTYEELSGDLTPIIVGNYTVTVSIKDGVEVYWADGANDDTNSPISYNFAITKAPLVVVVKVDDNGNVTIDCTGMVNGEPQPQLDLVYTDSQGNEVQDITNLEPDKYTITAVIHDANSNYIIDELTPAEYDVLEEVVGGNLLILKPELIQTEFTYTGDVIDVIDYLKHLDTTFEDVIGDLQVKDVGSYSVTVKFKDNLENVFWYDGVNNDDNQPLTFTFSILPAKIKDIWMSDPEGIPTLLTDEDKVEYIFYDKDDNPLYNDDGQPATKDDLKPGETYKVRAVINDENNNNYVFESTGTDKTDLKQFTVLFPAELEVPTLENSHLIYNGEEQTVVLIGYESEYMQYDPVELTKIDSNNYVITISIKDGAYAEWADGQPGTEREIAFDIGRAALDCVWEFDGKAPDLASLPDDATVAYIIKDENGNAVNAEHIVEGERYSITAILSDSSSANYYFAESRSDRVVTFFTYRINQKTVSEDSNFEDIFPFWSLLIIVVALVGGGVVWSKVASNIRENSEEKKNSKNNNN